MKTKVKRIIVLSLVLVLGLGIGAFAASQLEAVQAYLNYGITIRYNGIEQTMRDAKGNQVYPISYNGTTYVPIRAVSNMLGVEVNWDGATKTVYLGEVVNTCDFIDDLTPYYVGTFAERVPSSAGKTISIGGKTYDHWLMTNIYGKDFCYNLEGKYTKLTFKAFDKYFDKTLYLYGDNGAVLAQFDLIEEDLPKTYTVDVTGVNQLTIDGESMWIFDAIIE